MNTGKFRIKYGDVLICACLYFITAAFGLVMALKLRIPPVIDEVASIANPAYLLGHDWSEALYCMGGYYFKPAAVLIYYPIMKSVSEPYTAYKLMLGLNVLINSFIPIFAYRILHKYLGGGRITSAMLAFTTGIYPSTALYTLYARADAMLLFLLWPIICVFLDLVSVEGAPYGSRRAVSASIKRVFLSILLAILSVFAYMSHTRGSVVIIAVVLAAILVSLICSVKTVEWISFIGTSALMLVLDKKLSNYFYNALYGQYGTAFSSVESYDFSSLKKIFTPEGFVCFAHGVVGTAYNVLVSSYGLAAIAVFGGIAVVIKYIRSKSSASNSELAYVVLMELAFLGTFAMSCIYFYPYVIAMLNEQAYNRSDWLVYGRYVACAAGPAVLYGLYYLTCRHIKEKPEEVSRIITLVVSLLFTGGVGYFFCEKTLPKLEGISAVSRNFIQLCTFLKLNSEGGTTAVFENLGEALKMAGILGMATAVLILLFTLRFVPQKVRVIAVFAVFTVVSVGLTVVNYEKIRYSRDEILYTWINEPVAQLEEVSSIAGEYKVVVDSTAKDIKHYQYLLTEFICGNENTSAAEGENFFVIARKNQFKKIYGKGELYIFDDFDYENAAKDIVYIKGKELAEKLISMGYSISKYSGKYK